MRLYAKGIIDVRGGAQVRWEITQDGAFRVEPWPDSPPVEADAEGFLARRFGGAMQNQACAIRESLRELSAAPAG